MDLLFTMVVPLTIGGVALYGVFRGIDVYDALLRGAGEGLEVLFRIVPALVALMTAVYMLRASGALELAARAGCAYWFLAKWGYAGVCVAGPMAWLATGVLLFIYFHWFLFDKDGNLRHRTPHAL